MFLLEKKDNTILDYSNYSSPDFYTQIKIVDNDTLLYKIVDYREMTIYFLIFFSNFQIDINFTLDSLKICADFKEKLIDIFSST
ncbi:hypothetical protein BpHYR1_049791 [Brachionus plicatilis]|uniref:Uncharacterized protein n=1 Tax=Brachionus plicatilis TaxID=10195 RepID=A0A3M7RUX6_BRAPC|nr:hypothetical protein BpHYR1_049791 [Brachionus plicatilis]